MNQETIEQITKRTVIIEYRQPKGKGAKDNLQETIFSDLKQSGFSFLILCGSIVTDARSQAEIEQYLNQNFEKPLLK